MAQSYRKQMEHLIERTPEEWVELVARINDPWVCAALANLVWWDFFGEREYSERWEHLDEFRKGWAPLSVEEVSVVRATLVDWGYPENLAERRTRVLAKLAQEREEGSRVACGGN